MNQPTFTEGPPVPLMVEGLLDAGTLRQLFTDLGTAAEDLEIREKSDPRGYSGTAEQQLGQVLERLLTGAARAIQVRYRWDGHTWTDSILASPGGYRVVRCRQSE